MNDVTRSTLPSIAVAVRWGARTLSALPAYGHPLPVVLVDEQDAVSWS
jgi:hypothetical protein